MSSEKTQKRMPVSQFLLEEWQRCFCLLACGRGLSLMIDLLWQLMIMKLGAIFNAIFH